MRQQTLLFLANRIIGPIFLVVGLIVAFFMLEREILPIVFHDDMADGGRATGLAAIKIGLPLLVACFGIQLIRVKNFSKSKK